MAQVVARLTGGQEVASSSLVTPTISSVHNQPESWEWALDFFAFKPLCVYEQDFSPALFVMLIMRSGYTLPQLTTIPDTLRTYSVFFSADFGFLPSCNFVHINAQLMI